MPFDDAQMDDHDAKLSLPMDEANLPTQDICEIFSQPDSQQTIECSETKVWGKLFPMMESIAQQGQFQISSTNIFVYHCKQSFN